MKRVFIILGLVIILTLIYLCFPSSSFESASYYAADSNSIVFEEELKEGDTISFFFDPKVLVGTKSYLIILNSNGDEVLKWDKAREKNGKNKGEFRIKESGLYTMRIMFTDKSVSRKYAEVEVDWKFEK